MTVLRFLHFIFLIIVFVFPANFDARYLPSKNGALSFLFRRRLVRSPLTVATYPETAGSQPYFPSPRGTGNLCVDRSGGNVMGSAGHGGSFNINGVNPPNGAWGRGAGVGWGPQYMLGGGYQGPWFVRDSTELALRVLGNVTKSTRETGSKSGSHPRSRKKVVESQLKTSSGTNVGPDVPKFTPFRPQPNSSPIPFKPFAPNQRASQSNVGMQQQTSVGHSGSSTLFQRVPPKHQAEPSVTASTDSTQADANKQLSDPMKNGGVGSPTGGVNQRNNSNLCVNRREGQLQGQIVSSSTFDFNIQGQTKDGPYGFRSGSTWSRPTVFGANWGGPYFVHDC